MKKKYNNILCLILMICMAVSGCGTAKNPKAEEKQTQTDAKEENKPLLEDGIYTVDFDTDSGMFHVSEACDGKGTLTVEKGEMTLHISLASKKILNLYPGLAKDAEKEGAEILEPTTDTVTYSDGMTEEVFGFDVPVSVLDEEFDLALIGTKGKWYDHKVSISNPTKKEKEVSSDLEDGTYQIAVDLAGGSGKAKVSSPALLIVEKGSYKAHIEWSSPHYDYMKTGEETYRPINTEGNSVFEIPVSVFDEPMPVIADTTAMGTPHEIEYTLTFHLDSAEMLSESMAR